MVRPKGIPSHMKGRTYEEIYGLKKSKEIRENLSRSHIKISDVTWAMRKWFKGRPLINKSRFIKGNICWNKDKKGYHIHSEEEKNKRRERMKLNNPAKSLEARRKIGLSKLGKKRPDMLGDNNPAKRIEVREKIKKNNPKYWFGKIGEKHPAWQGGKSFEPYTLDFNEKFKETVRKRDSYCCQLCNTFEEDHLKLYNSKLCVHHIDYTKKNSFLQNGITLCFKCNSIVNKDREIWTKHFQELLKKLYNYQYTYDQKIILDFRGDDV